MSKSIVLALCGCRRVGKDTVASHLLASGSRWHHVKISHALKKAVAYLFDLTEQEVEGESKDCVVERRQQHAADGLTPRRIMQWFGTDVMQHALCSELSPSTGRNFWINRAIVDIRRALDSGCSVVISDVRFHHEVDALRSEFGDDLLCLYISRDSLASSGDAESTHESEANVATLRERMDSVIVNREGEIDRLLRDCDDAISTRRI